MIKIALFLLLTNGQAVYINQFTSITDCAEHGAMITAVGGVGFSCVLTENK